MKKKIETVQIWSAKGLSDLSGETYLARRQALLNGISMIDRLQFYKPGDEVAALQLIEILEQISRLKETLLAACRAAETLSSADSKIAAEKVFILETIDSAEKAIQKVKENLQEAAEKNTFRSDKLERWLQQLSCLKEIKPWLNFSGATLEEERLILGPLFSLYTHLKSSIRTSVTLPDGTVKKSTPSVANFAVKNTSDPELRTLFFNALSACFATNSSMFCDILNAVAGAHLLRASRLGMSTLDYALIIEGLDRKSFEAMRSAFSKKLSEIRECLRFVAPYINQGTNRPDARTIPVALLGSALPHLEGPESLKTFDGTLKEITEAVEPYFSEFRDFIEICRQGHWLETHNYSAGSGGAWCVEVPYDKAVAIYVDYQPNINRSFETAHILGDAFFRYSISDLPMQERRLSETRYELIGRLFEELLLGRLVQEASSPQEKAAVLWHGLRRIMINLVEIPFRFKLAEEIFKARKNGYLSVEDINKLTRKCWSDCYGDTVEGVDQYMWARKPHFYNVYNADSPHHDFQYTVGFLSANKMLKKLREIRSEDIPRICRSVLLDNATLTFEEVFSKNFNADIRTEQFWTNAIEESLHPLRDIRPYVGELDRSQG